MVCFYDSLAFFLIIKFISFFYFLGSQASEDAFAWFSVTEKT